jgi:hypothetical protein
MSKNDITQGKLKAWAHHPNKKVSIAEDLRYLSVLASKITETCAAYMIYICDVCLFSYMSMVFASPIFLVFAHLLFT